MASGFSVTLSSSLSKVDHVLHLTMASMRASFGSQPSTPAEKLHSPHLWAPTPTNSPWTPSPARKRIISLNTNYRKIFIALCLILGIAVLNSQLVSWSSERVCLLASHDMVFLMIGDRHHHISAKLMATTTLLYQMQPFSPQRPFRIVSPTLLTPSPTTSTVTPVTSRR